MDVGEEAWEECKSRKALTAMEHDWLLRLGRQRLSSQGLDSTFAWSSVTYRRAAKTDKANIVSSFDIDTVVRPPSMLPRSRSKCRWEEAG